jgi:hypothetical protein
VARNILKKAIQGNLKGHHVFFERTTIRNHNLIICIDKIEKGKPYYIVELKVQKDKKLLREAMRYLMVECPIAAVQTTQGKSELFCKLNK